MTVKTTFLRKLVLTTLTASALAASGRGVARVSSMGYLPDDIKAAVYLGNRNVTAAEVSITDRTGHTYRADMVTAEQPWQSGQEASRV